MARDRTIRIVILGDTCFGESYQDRLASQGREPVLRTRGYDHMIRDFADILSESDFTIANLETPVTDRFPSPFVGLKPYIHYSDVEQTPLQLVKYGIHLVSLANNHAFDYGLAGLEQTWEALSAHDIEFCGVGRDAAAAGQPYIRRFELGNQHLDIAVLCSMEHYKGYDEKLHWYASGDAGGVNVLSTEQVGSVVEALRQEHANLFVIAYPHWGDNYRLATDRQRMQGQAMIDAGVDLILGHGAHMLQEFERYRDRWIGYGLGNFVFGSPGRYAMKGAPPYGAIAVLMLSPAASGIAVKLRIYPIFLNNLITNYQTRFVTEAEFRQARRIIEKRNSAETPFDELVSSGRDEHGFFLELDGLYG